MTAPGAAAVTLPLALVFLVVVVIASGLAVVFLAVVVIAFAVVVVMTVTSVTVHGRVLVCDLKMLVLYFYKNTQEISLYGRRTTVAIPPLAIVVVTGGGAPRHVFSVVHCGTRIVLLALVTEREDACRAVGIATASF